MAHASWRVPTPWGTETHPVASSAGVLKVHHELGLDRRALVSRADVRCAPGEVGGCIACDSFDVTGALPPLLGFMGAESKPWAGTAR